MSRSRFFFSCISSLLVSGVLLSCPIAASAQRHGTGGGSSLAGSGSLNGISRPNGVDEKDSLKDFHQVLAVQASTQQIAEFQALVKSTEAAQAELQALLQRLHNAAEPATADALDRALENMRSGTRKFQEGFSPAQKSGLKDISKRLAKADSDLEQEDKKLAQSLLAKSASAEILPHADALDKALTDFYNQQLALGREMSITLASGQDLTFTLPRVKTPVNLGSQIFPVTVSGLLTQTAVQGGQRTFKIQLSADLSELQQNITELLRNQLEASQSCSQRVTIRQAALATATPASVLTVWLHFERWLCTGPSGQQSASELAEADGKVEIKLTALVEKPNTLKVLATFGRIDATGMLADSLRSGSLGEDLRDQIAQSLLSAARAATDSKIALPPALQNSAAIESAKFQDVGVGALTVELAGQIEISNQQADQLASQLNQSQSAQAPAAQ